METTGSHASENATGLSPGQFVLFHFLSQAYLLLANLFLLESLYRWCGGRCDLCVGAGWRPVRVPWLFHVQAVPQNQTLEGWGD